VVMFAAGRRSGELKDSAAYAEESGEFSVNIVSEEVAEAMNATAQSYPGGVDEFEMCGLTTWYGTATKAPMVAEAPANFECRVMHAFDLGGETGPRIVFGEVVAIHVREDIVDGTRIDHDALAAVGRMAGNEYVPTTDRFELIRPAQWPRGSRLSAAVLDECRVGVDHHAVEIHPEVEMRAGPGGVAGIAHVADDVARPDPAVLTEL